MKSVPAMENGGGKGELYVAQAAQQQFKEWREMRYDIISSFDWYYLCISGDNGMECCIPELDL
ncbi:putative membrane protein [Gossypium australe]|uniref:Putative membrane protein n=1 Tax=Gossypium australe TaxID=47621 RepID=A0A5B6VS17_9ROSI|nr:putative membrane protein [Gossypium australe]